MEATDGGDGAPPRSFNSTNETATVAAPLLLDDRFGAVHCAPFDAVRALSPSLAPQQIPYGASLDYGPSLVPLPLAAGPAAHGPRPAVPAVLAALADRPSDMDAAAAANDWRMVLYHEQNIILYNPSAQPSIRSRRLALEDGGCSLPGTGLANTFGRCPLCRQPVDARFAFVAQAYFDILQELHRRSVSTPPVSALFQRLISSESSIEIQHNPFLLAEEAPDAPRERAAFAFEGGADAEAAAAAALRHLPPELLNTGYYARFFIETRKLGSGSFGSVFLCQHVLDDLRLGDYAVKKVPVGDNKTWLRDMVREVKTFERLHHPNIVEYKHSWLELSRSSLFCPFVPFLFILMQFCNGGSLDRLIWHEGDPARPKAPPLVAMIWRLLVDVMYGLQHLHRQGILHRDLKPTNILLQWPSDDVPADSCCTGSGELSGTSSDPSPSTAAPRAVLSDFGTSLPLGEPAAAPTTSRGYTGTVEYTAPELFGGNASTYSEKSDMWSLGVVLYALCFSALPFTHDDPSVLKGLIRRFVEERGRLVDGEDDATAWLPPDSACGGGGRRRLGTLRLVTAALLSPDAARRPSASDLLENPAFRMEAARQAASSQQHSAAVADHHRAAPALLPDAADT